MSEIETRREIAAQATQSVIVEAATRLFIEHGYAATSVGDIAAAAGVAVQTIYNAIGPKREVLSRVLDFAAAGDEAPRPVPDFMRVRAEGTEHARDIIRQLVAFWREGLARTAPVFGVIRQAAALDPEVAELESRRAAQRLSNYGHAAKLLADRGALRHGLSARDAAATMFAVGHPDMYRFFVLERGWTAKRWAGWAEKTLTSALLLADSA